MKFSLGQITDRTENGMYSLVVFAFFSFLITSIYDALEVIFLTGNQKWDDGVGNYISIAELIIFVAVCILAFHRRNDSTIEWLKPHLKRAWRMCLFTLIAFIVVTIIFFVVSESNSVDYESAKYSKTVEEFSNFIVFVNALIFVPWSMLALVKIKDDKNSFAENLQPNSRPMNVTNDEASINENSSVKKKSNSYIDLVKFAIVLVFFIGWILHTIDKKFIDIGFNKNILSPFIHLLADVVSDIKMLIGSLF